jgi:hypothetical protein
VLLICVLLLRFEVLSAPCGSLQVIVFSIPTQLDTLSSNTVFTISKSFNVAQTVSLDWRTNKQRETVFDQQ